ncbi:MAG: hypothetical protein DLM60_08645 [Pseudonocardiales bacterium]|nr:MAG: hypothetical protein DLM60_08645 [Pseudonocardiales bacterium]
MSMDIRTSMDKRHVPNAVLIRLREEQGWGRPRLAKQFELIGRRHGIPTPEPGAMEKQIYRLETGRTLRPTPMYAKLYCLTFDRTTLELFGDLEAGVPAGATCATRSHKFIPVFVGAEAASNLGTGGGQWSYVNDQWTACRRLTVEHSTGSCQLYLWPFGVALFHLIEDLAFESVAHLAVWRRITYEQNMRWAHDQLQKLVGSQVAGQPYVLSLYWVDEPAWQGNDLHTALRLMCIPRLLVPRADNIDESCLASAALVERALLENCFDHPELVDFGMKGISFGYASWSGVVYHPIARDRALREDELVNCELSVQAAWAYCDHLRQQVENGYDPTVPSEFGWRFLRGIRSRLTTERPQETSQHRSMRDAVVETSGLGRHLAQAMEILRDCDRT